MNLFPFLVAAAVQAVPAPAPAPVAGVAAGDDDIVVTAAQRRAEAVLLRQVASVLPPAAFDQPIARFTVPVCPGVTGMSAASAQAVVDRIGVIADDVGLRVGEPGCDPNLLVIVTDNGAETVRRLVARRSGFFRSQTLTDIRRIVGEGGGARAWIEIALRSRDGDVPDVGADGEPPVLRVQAPSRIVLSHRHDIVSAVIVLDAAVARGRDTRQIADYAAMRGLADARPGRMGRVDTVLRAFGPAASGDGPAELTAFDRGLLRGLYRGQGNVPAGVKHAAIARGMARGERAGD